MTHEPGAKQYPFFGAPPARQPRPALEERALRGKRVILSMPDGFVYDMRAASDIQRDDKGRAIVDIVSEEHYYRWMLLKERPTRQVFPAALVWVE